MKNKKDKFNLVQVQESFSTEVNQMVKAMDNMHKNGWDFTKVTNLVIENIDFNLLYKQRNKLIQIRADKEFNFNESEIDTLEGIINLLEPFSDKYYNSKKKK